MSVTVEIALQDQGYAVYSKVEAENYTYSEQSSPLSGADTSGSVGTFSVTIRIPDVDVKAPSAVRSLWYMRKLIGDNILLGANIILTDTRKGFTSGTVNRVERSDDEFSVTLSGMTRMGLLNIYNIQAQPYTGTLGGAVAYYLGLAGVTTGFTVDSSVSGTPVAIPGWYGELWLHMKQLVSAYACDISLVSNIILVRPVRERVAAANRDTSRAQNVGGGNLAQAVEVYQYNNRSITNELVYPVGGPTSEDRVLNVNAGETAEYTLPLSASLSSFIQPTMVTTMDPNYVGGSAYVVSGNDGVAIDPAVWASGGGKVIFTLDETTSNILVSLSGATRLTNTQGDDYTSFSLSLNNPDTGNRFSALRILGSGVAFTKEKRRIRTGVPASMTGTDVGVTIDNPFVSTANDVARVGLRAAREYSGLQMILSGTVISVNRRGDTGQVSVPTYQQVQDALVAAIGGTPTYSQVQSYYTGLGLTTYQQIQDYWAAYFRNDDVDQVFGNVQGARIFDKKSRRWYRIRNANPGPREITFDSAEDDLTYEDFQNYNAGKTYSDIQTKYTGFTYRLVDLAGLYG